MFKNLTKKKLKEKLYGLKVERYLASVHFSDIVDVIDSDQENLVHLPEEGYQPFTDGVVRTYKDGDIYALYYDRVRITINNCKEKIVKVSILGQGDVWKVWELDAKGKNMKSIDSPDSNAYTVYTFCNILMPTGRMMCDERYTTGTWNEYVYESVLTIIDFINSFKEKNKFNNYYNF